jgi:uncharacterized membrane protein YkvA (DUF1232 family)
VTAEGIFYHPKDFLADDEYGLFGYLDDAYLVAVVYERVMQELLEEGVALSREDLEFQEKIGKLKQTARSVIKEESRKIDQMVGQILEGNNRAYLALFD